VPLRSHSPLNGSRRRTKLRRHQSCESTLLDSRHQRTVGSLPARCNPVHCFGQETDAGPAEFTPGMDCRGYHHSGNVRRWHSHVRCVDLVGSLLSAFSAASSVGRLRLHPFGATSRPLDGCVRQKRNGASPRERARTIYMRANRQFLYIKQPDVIRRSQFSTEETGLPPFSPGEPQA
jgi:hypothetical protein